MFCPRCRSLIESSPAGARCRASGAELSTSLYQGLVEACVVRGTAGDVRLSVTVGGIWFCPGCANGIVERDGRLTCPSCGTCLNRLVFALVDMFVHPPPLAGTGVTMGLEFALRLQGATRTGQDRAITLPLAGGYLLAVADGAGGTAGGAEAAEFVLWSLHDVRDHSADWAGTLRRIDRELASRSGPGETTVVVAHLGPTGIDGASVGDSSAWLIHEQDACIDLTSAQVRKPLVGSGLAVPVSFSSRQAYYRVLLGSDGLFKYLSPQEICELSRLSRLEDAADALVNAVRLPSGSLQDDVAVIVAG